jgi:hypothetical protein
MGVAWGNFLKAQESCAKVVFDDKWELFVILNNLQIEHKSGKL